MKLCLIQIACAFASGGATSADFVEARDVLSGSAAKLAHGSVVFNATVAVEIVASGNNFRGAFATLGEVDFVHALQTVAFNTVLTLLKSIHAGFARGKPRARQRNDV